MSDSGLKRRTKKMAVFLALPVCIFTAVLFRSPANTVITADMPGGVSRYSNGSREIRSPSEYVHGKTDVQKAVFFDRGA